MIRERETSLCMAICFTRKTNNTHICFVYKTNRQMDTLINRYKRLLAATSTTYVRSLMDTIHWDARLVAIRGARGVGKTTLMLHTHYALCLLAIFG